MANDTPMNFVTSLLVTLFLIVVVLGVLVYVFKPGVVNNNTQTKVVEGDTYYNYTTINECEDQPAQQVQTYYYLGKPGVRYGPCDFYDNKGRDGACRVEKVIHG